MNSAILAVRDRRELQNLPILKLTEVRRSDRPSSLCPTSDSLTGGLAKGETAGQGIKDRRSHYDLRSLRLFSSGNHTMQSMAVSAGKKRGNPPPHGRDLPCGGGGCPMFSPPGEPQLGVLLAERTSTFCPQRASLLLQGDVLGREGQTAMLLGTS